MVNLLSIESKKEITSEYRTRLFISTLFILSVITVIMTLFQAPALFSLVVQERTVEQELNSLVGKDQEEKKALDALIAETNTAVALLSPEQHLSPSQKIIDIALKRGDITLESFVFENNPTGAKVMRIKGVSPSRDALLSFIKALEASGFKDVSAPISSFIKERNISFSLELSL